jgi:hypothetical protein
LFARTEILANLTIFRGCLFAAAEHATNVGIKTHACA